MKKSAYLSLLFFLAGIGSRAAVGGGAEGGSLKRTLSLVARHELSGLEIVQDLRWIGADQLILAAGSDGVQRLHLKSGAMERVGLGGEELTGFASRLAPMWRLGPSLVVAAPFFHLHLLRGQGVWADSRLEAVPPFDFIADMDGKAGELLVLGARAERVGSRSRRYGRGDALVWKGEVRPGSAKLRSVLQYGRSIMRLAARCSVLELGAVRFLRSGGYALASGMTQDIQIYWQEGGVPQIVDAVSLSLDMGCDLSDRAVDRIHRDLAHRVRWISQHRVLDEMLPLFEGLGMVVREGRGEGRSPEWFLYIVPAPAGRGRGGSVESVYPVGPVPVATLPMPKDLAPFLGRIRVKGDVWRHIDGRQYMALLLVDQNPGHGSPPPTVLIYQLNYLVEDRAALQE